MSVEVGSKMHHRVKDLTGERFGRLTVIERAGSNKHNNSLWLCECDCGNRVTKSSNLLRNGKLPSCGCDRSLYARSGKVKHGMYGTKIYLVWQAMKERAAVLSKQRGCHASDLVCDRWRDLKSFHEDVGEAPESGQFTLIEKTGRYEPGNVHWVTKKAAANNRKSNRIIEVEGQRMTISQAAERFGVRYATLVVRLNRLHMSPSEAVSRPVRKWAGKEKKR